MYFYFTAAGVVPCGSRKKPPRTSSIVQIIFYFSSLRSEDNYILNNQEILIGLDSCFRLFRLIFGPLLNRLPSQI